MTRELPAALAETVGMTVEFRTLTPHGRALMDTLGVNVVFAARRRASPAD